VYGVFLDLSKRKLYPSIQKNETQKRRESEFDISNMCFTSFQSPNANNLKKTEKKMLIAWVLFDRAIKGAYEHYNPC